MWEINTEVFWNADDILLLEETHRKLCGLIKFLKEEGDGKKLVITQLADQLISQTEGKQL